MNTKQDTSIKQERMRNNDRNQDSNDIESHFLVCSFRTYIADCVNIEAPEVEVDIDEGDKDAIDDGQA